MNDLRLCVACTSPSPGPMKKLYYQHRTYGPYFPILEDRKTAENSNLFNGGRVIVCTSCASHLQRQWTSYEKSWTPIERRTYKLRSDKKDEQKAEKESRHSVAMAPNDEPDHTPRPAWKHVGKQITAQNNVMSKLQHENHSDKGSSPSTGRLSVSSFNSDDNSPFRRAVKKVTKQNKAVVRAEGNGMVKLQAVVEEARYVEQRQRHKLILDDPDKGHIQDGELRNGGYTSRGRAAALWSLPREEIRSHVRNEMEESIEIMIRKIAEIQHLENMRQSERALKEAAERVCKAQDREEDIHRMVHELRVRLREELMFRDTGRVLMNDKEGRRREKKGEQNERRVANGVNPTEGSMEASVGIGDVGMVKRVGRSWKVKAVGESDHSKAREGEMSLVPNVSVFEGIPETRENQADQRELERRKHEQFLNQQQLATVKQELVKEREWRRETEAVISNQRAMIEELRQGIQGEVQRLVKEQAKRYEELKKESLITRDGATKLTPEQSPTEQAYVSLDGRFSREKIPHDHGDSLRAHRHQQEAMIRDERNGWAEKEDEEEEDEEDDDIRATRPKTPQFYIQ